MHVAAGLIDRASTSLGCRCTSSRTIGGAWQCSPQPDPDPICAQAAVQVVKRGRGGARLVDEFWKHTHTCCVCVCVSVHRRQASAHLVYENVGHCGHGAVLLIVGCVALSEHTDLQPWVRTHTRSCWDARTPTQLPPLTAGVGLDCTNPRAWIAPTRMPG